MRPVLAFLLAAAVGTAQDPEAGVVNLNISDRLLRIETYRPLDSAAYILAEDYHLHVNAEDPPFACKDDVIDTKPAQSFALASPHAYFPKIGSFEVRFSVDAKCRQVDVNGLLRQIVLAYNNRSSFRYRLQTDGDVFSFVPVGGRNDRCQQVPFTALLDQRISIPKADRATHVNLRLFEEALGVRAGEPVGLNAPAWLNGGIPPHFTLEARDEPARDVLLRIIKVTHYRFYWLAREQPLRQGWTINLEPLKEGIVKDPWGGYSYPRILWPGAKPLPPVPPPSPRTVTPERSKK